MWATAVTKQIDKNKTTIPLEKHISNMRQYFVDQRKTFQIWKQKSML